ncbi:MAG: methyltransferase domain-containing protein [Gemmatimonadetes bacterium]|nr:methyltransferase domain-containing protein [Gemmatimonadota bacterium]MYK51230.1 methyltransferase domain-containing protein [Gemmatimonadota bacterium]
MNDGIIGSGGMASHNKRGKHVLSTAAKRDYLLGTNDEELHRLQAQHNTWQAETTDLWDRATFRAGQTILDLGCGPGFTSLELGERVGAGGRVLAVDGSKKFADFLRHRAASASMTQIEVVVADVRTLDLPVASIDAVFARWLLCFIEEPQKVIEQVARTLKRGGHLLVMDYCTYGAFVAQIQYPHLRRVLQAVHRSFGDGLEIGDKLPQLMERCGLEVVEVIPIGGIARPGNRIWCWIEDFLRMYLPELVARGALREEDCAAHWEEWQTNARDPQATISSPSMVGVIGVKI